MDAFATYDDFKKVPSDQFGEILNGRLIRYNKQGPKHSVISTALAGELVPSFVKSEAGPGGWTIIERPELHLGFHIVQPSLAGWKNETMASLPDDPKIEIVPDWICEILCPESVRYTRLEKRAIYADYEVSNLWLVDPLNRLVETFELNESDQWVLSATFAESAEMAIAPFQKKQVELSALWNF